MSHKSFTIQFPALLFSTSHTDQNKKTKSNIDKKIDIY